MKNPVKEVLKPSKKSVSPWNLNMWAKFTHCKKGHRYSLQYHEKKKETQYLLKGKIKFTLGKSKDAFGRTSLNSGDKLGRLPRMIIAPKPSKIFGNLGSFTNDLDDVVKLSPTINKPQRGKGNDLDLDAEN